MVKITKDVKTRLASRLWKPITSNGITITPCTNKSCDTIFVDDEKASKIVFEGGQQGLNLKFDKKIISIDANNSSPRCRFENDVFRCTFDNSHPIKTNIPHADAPYEVIQEFMANNLSLRSRPKVNMMEYNALAGIGLVGGGFSFLSPIALAITAPLLMALEGGGILGSVEVLDNNARTKFLLPDQVDLQEIYLPPDKIERVTFYQHPFLIKMNVTFKEPLNCVINEKTDKIRLDGYRRMDCSVLK